MRKNKKITTKKSSKDIAKQREAYFKKIEEYDKLTLEQIEEQFVGKKLPGGVYKLALVEVVRKKQLDRIAEEAKANLEAKDAAEPAVSNDPDVTAVKVD